MEGISQKVEAELTVLDIEEGPLFGVPHEKWTGS
jgi:hypothetical protein